ncbi:MAG TPA: hypothetical protein VL576_01250 [Candidatus Paceibacterota bacterium]|jgi:hypothetical protein|nr:hypothetical protein [Candidatus Paceibacterota bacterium]
MNNRRSFIVVLGTCDMGMSLARLARIEHLVETLHAHMVCSAPERYHDRAEALLERVQKDVQQRLELSRKMAEEFQVIHAATAIQIRKDIVFDKSALFKKHYFPPSPILSQLKAPFFHKSRARSHL